MKQYPCGSTRWRWPGVIYGCQWVLCAGMLHVPGMLGWGSLRAQGEVVLKPAAPAAGLVAHWKADGDAMDAAGGLHGQTFNATYAPGVVGSAFDIKSPSYSAVIIDEAALNESYAALTIAAWVNARSHGRHARRDIGRTVLSRTEDGGFALRVKEGVIELDLRTEAGDRRTERLVFPGAKVPLHAWSLVVATYDGQTARAYLDGRALPPAIPVTGRLKKTTLPPARLMIGNEPGTNPRQPFQKTDPGDLGWHGLLDEVRVYDRALGPAEVAALYESTRPAVAHMPPPPPPSPIAVSPRPGPRAEQLRRALLHTADAWRDPAFYVVSLWFVCLLMGRRALPSFLATIAIFGVAWTVCALVGRPFRFNWGAPHTMMHHAVLVGLGYGSWRLWVHLTKRPRATATVALDGDAEPLAAKAWPKGRLPAMLGGAVMTCVFACIAAIVILAILAKLQPFALLLYAIVGLPHLALLGAIGGAVAHGVLSPARPAVCALNAAISALIALLATGLLALLDRT